MIGKNGLYVIIPGSITNFVVDTLYNFCKTFERNYHAFHCFYNFNI